MTSACLEQGGELLEQKEDSLGIVEGKLESRALSENFEQGGKVALS